MNEGFLNLIYGYLKRGLSVLPIVPGTKKPAVSWKVYQERLPTIEEARKWFQRKHPMDVAIVAGRVSGNLEFIDIDNHIGDADRIFWEWKEILNGTLPGLFDKLVIQKTQSGGYHIVYRANTVISGNTKLASRVVNGKHDTFIETRGEGGYALVYPSDGYSLLQNTFPEVPVISAEERELLLDICRSFNQIEKEPPTIKSKEYTSETKKDRPGDLFNKEGDIHKYLEKHGWRLVHRSGPREFWQRPGKSGRGWSATFNFIPNKFYVFSSNAPPFEPEHSYDKFSVYALLEHGGDFRKAAKELAELGFVGNGKPRLKKVSVIIDKTSVDLNHSLNGDLPPLTQIGNAMRFLKKYKDTLKYNFTTKEWLIWDGTRWRPDTKDNIRLLAKAISDSIIEDEGLYIAAGYDPKAIRAWHKSSQTLRNIDDSLKLAACEPEFATTHNDWDRNLYLVNFANGTLDLKSMEFRKNDPNDMITKVIPIEYDPKAECPTWLAALDMYFNGNQELIEFVQKICGLSLCGAHLEEIIVFLYGTGANGKSIFVNTIRYIYGEYASLLPIEALITQRFDDSKKSEIASLVGARFVVTTEIPINKHLNEATVKMLTGGDAVKVRNLYQNFFTFEPTFILWIFGNHKPEIKGADNGIWRRMVLIPFEQTIPPEKRLPQSVILEQLKGEAPGILTWIVNGWKKYIDEGLKIPKIVATATSNYKDDQDLLFDFFNDSIVIDKDGKEKGTDLYEAYTKWCEEHKEHPIGKKTFFRLLEEKGFPCTKDRKQQKVFIGLSLCRKTQPCAENLSNFDKNNDKIEEYDDYDEPF
ncbi:MAG: hypothetical protein CH6_0081 [Candidatus Kapaibacterium sp.]|nr:MAG: hypothetical protein CH6_0081 [Candidatus Kapabacteria bacterium]